MGRAKLRKWKQPKLSTVYPPLAPFVGKTPRLVALTKQNSGTLVLAFDDQVAMVWGAGLAQGGAVVQVEVGTMNHEGVVEEMRRELYRPPHADVLEKERFIGVDGVVLRFSGNRGIAVGLGEITFVKGAQ